MRIEPRLRRLEELRRNPYENDPRLAPLLRDMDNGRSLRDVADDELAVCRRERVFPRDSVLGGHFEAKTRVAGAFLPSHSTINEVDKLLSDRLLELLIAWSQHEYGPSNIDLAAMSDEELTAAIDGDGSVLERYRMATP